MTAFVDDVGFGTLRDWMNSVLGKKLGAGIGRHVFVFDIDPRYVAKVETGGFQNVIEHQIWDASKDTQYAKWFAPVTFISGMGTVLLMERTTPAPPSAFPAWMPDFLGDLKYSNFGLLRGNLVCHDYGTLANWMRGFSRDKLNYRKADWWHAGDGSSFQEKT
jgi:hypothetical protein